MPCHFRQQKESLRNARDLAEAMSDPASRPQATFNFKVYTGDFKKQPGKSKSAAMKRASVQYIGADTDDDNEETSPTPDPFEEETLPIVNCRSFPSCVFRMTSGFASRLAWSMRLTEATLALCSTILKNGSIGSKSNNADADSLGKRERGALGSGTPGGDHSRIVY